MRLYHFTSERFGLAAIKDRRIKIARINELNDPFEFLGLALEREDRRVMNAWKNEIDAGRGLICMSADWHHPLLWGHYADKYKGMALGFDVPEDGAFAPVEYTSLRPTLAEFGRASLADLTENDMKKLLFRKFEAWRYEAEYRAFCGLDDKDPKTGLYFLPFSGSLKLAEVVIGHRCAVTRAVLKDALGDLSDDVRSFKARPGFQRFEVVENMRGSDWK